MQNWIAVGGRDLSCTLHLPEGAYTQAAAAEEFTQWSSPHDATRFDESNVRMALGPRSPAGAAEGDESRSIPWPRVAVFLMLAVLCLVSGGLFSGAWLSSLGPHWRWVVLLPPTLLCWPAGVWATSNAHRPRLVRLGTGVMLTGSPTVVGYFWAQNQPDGLSQQITMLAVTAVLAVAAIGTWFAVRRSWISRNAHWLVPALMVPFPLVLPWTGRFLHAAYLSEVLGIPVDAVHIPFYWHFFITVKPLAIAGLVVLCVLGLAGWARYHHWWANTRWLVVVVLPMILALYFLLVMVTAVGRVDEAAEMAAADARAGKRPGHYYGLQGELMCVHPHRRKIPVFNGPLPVDRPVLTYGNSGDDLWLWDPASSRGKDLQRHALRVPAGDVTLTPARGGSCPSS
ncbi:hypothetical protein [Streptomyces aculeolatus]|uniref:hypothetical protein n=1 Tax=Streptomyces aculeolatus TaxID=270689 RepID=UPI001CECBB76|nr:hypothetical protein [Streptomyces aculeolatus]